MKIQQGPRTKKILPTVTITTHGGQDGQGRTRFTADWFDENHHQGPRRRGQCFHADLTQAVASWKLKGYRVRVVRGKP